MHAQEAPPSRQMTWPQFFAVRRRLQLVQRFAGLPFVFGFWAAEGFVLSMPIFDPTRTVMDVDPMILVGLTTIGGTLASYFLGAACVGWLWRVLKRDTTALLDQVRPSPVLAHDLISALETEGLLLAGLQTPCKCAAQPHPDEL